MKLLRLLAAVLPLCAAGLWAADASGNGLTTPESLFPQLDAILKQAVTQSPRMVARAVDEEIAENDRIVARAGLLPNVGGYYRFQEAEDKRADKSGRLSVEKVYYDFNVTQPLYHWGERRNNERMAVIRQAITAGNVRDAYRSLAQEIRAGYLRLILAKLRVKRAAFYNAMTAANLKHSEERLAKKVISDAQMFSIRMDAERAQISDERTRWDYENERASFARLTGQPAPADDQVPDTIPAINPQDATLQSLLGTYLSQQENPSNDAQVMRRSMEIDRLALANAQTRLRPKLNLVAGVSQDEQSYSLNVAQKYQVNSYYAGFSLNWTIFDGFAAGASERNVRARLRQSEREYRALNERLAQQAQNQLRLAGFTARYCNLNDRYLSSAEGALQARQADFARGVCSEDDVNASQMNLLDSQLNALSSRADYYNQVGDFLGTIMEDPALSNLAKR